MLFQGERDHFFFFFNHCIPSITFRTLDILNICEINEYAIWEYKTCIPLKEFSSSQGSWERKIVEDTGFLEDTECTLLIFIFLVPCMVLT